MRRPLIVGNWKMNTSVVEGAALARSIASQIGRQSVVEVAICPPFVSLTSVAAAVRGHGIAVGVQTVSEHEAGAYTGEVAVNMVSGLADFAIVGHSERRSHFGETDEQISRKVAAVIRGGMIPILCVGESIETRESGKAEQFVRDQVKSCLAHYNAGEPLVIAYEPVWAIGTGKAATLPQIEYMVASIREEVADSVDSSTAESTRILYGGSVNPGNIDEVASSTCIDGALVGGASLIADDFVAIVKAQAAAAANRT